MDRRPKLGLAGTSFVVSAVLLALEVGHIRLLSYATDPRLVYGAISIAFAGLGGGSIAVALAPVLARGHVRRRLSRLCAALAIAIVLHAVVFAQLSPSFSAASAWLTATRALPLLAVCAVPYVIGGAALSITVAAARAAVHRVYAFGLIGSALGCFALFPLMRRVGLEALIATLAVVSAGAAVAIAREARPRADLALPLVALVAAAALTWPPLAARVMPFRADPSDLLGIAGRAFVATHPGAPADFAPHRDFAGWDPVSRVEVFTFPDDFGLLNGAAPIKLVTQDGGAGTILVAFADHDDARRAWVERSVYATGYLLAPKPPRVLIVGLGGGVDAVTALHHGAGHVTGIEINATILDVSSRRFGAFQGGVLGDARVELVHADGRSFIESRAARGERWSHIQMSGADTYSAGSTGAFMFSESYLYTVEAFERYLTALEPGGILSLIRFGPEPLRTVVTAREALRRLGVDHPERHFFVLRQGICAGIAISREPLSEQAVDRAIAKVALSARGSRVSLPMWQAMGFGINEPIALEYAPGRTPQSLYQGVLASDQKTLAAVLDALPLDYTAASDDRPFFFQFLKPRDWLHLDDLGPSNFFAVGLAGHMRLCLGFVVLAALLAFAPLFAARKSPGARALPLGYFACLGAGYMLVELVLIQRTVLLLGHPTHSVSVTIATLLVGSGIGSWLAGRPRLSRAAPWAQLAVVLLIVIDDLVLGRIVAALLPLPWLVRAAGLAAVVLPLGVLLGMPFPLGLERAGREGGPSLVAWGLGVNGFSGVFGSLVAVPLAMLVGFRVVLIGAALIYLCAALLFRLAFARLPPAA